MCGKAQVRDTFSKVFKHLPNDSMNVKQPQGFQDNRLHVISVYNMGALTIFATFELVTNIQDFDY